jgi:two-component system response regulator AdeR
VSPAKRILLVEDDRFLLRAAEIKLRRSGFAVIVARDGADALHLASLEAPDLILLDLVLPRVSGSEVLRTLKRQLRTAHIPVIVLSNLGLESEIRQSKRLGAVAYLIKSQISLEELVKHVRQVLESAVPI